ncbi:hypothetical protein [Algibacter pacificus]|uniref:hypothetical protein n=1 Tax=Algibacter pacificus TaxID=2599389 RepID=UPI0011C94D99|nr:hypothetical protein [Algibacter pacificus]
MKKLVVILVLVMSNVIEAQKENLPYYEIPKFAENYTAGSVASRMVDALGFRYYWATEGLTSTDLSYKPSESARTSEETIEHIYNLSRSILNAVSKDNKNDGTKLSFQEQRKQTLNCLKKASDILRACEDISQYDSGNRSFWYMINGPISDAIWHCGQLVTLRRASGNPIHPNINFFTGKVKK